MYRCSSRWINGLRAVAAELALEDAEKLFVDILGGTQHAEWNPNTPLQGVVKKTTQSNMKAPPARKAVSLSSLPSTQKHLELLLWAKGR
jgi:hypothetical protein